MTEHVETTLRWIGDWPWWIGVPAAVVLGGAAWLLYRRDVSTMSRWLRVALPALRALTVIMIVLMLSGPVLHHRKTIGELAKLWVCVDGSASMTLADASMELGRKVLILERLEILSPGAIALDLPHAIESLNRAQAVAERTLGIAGIETAQWTQALSEFMAQADDAASLVERGAPEEDRPNRLRKEIIEPAKELKDRPLKQIDDRNRALQDLGKLAETTHRWEAQLEEVFEKKVGPLTSAEGSLQTAMAKFDAMPRWQRVQALLLENGEPRLLGALAQNYDVRLLSLTGHEADLIWQPTARSSQLPDGLPKPAGMITDLAGGLKSAVGGLEKELTGAVVLISDGQQNDGASPVEVAKVLQGRETPIYAIGVGSEKRPRDVAIIKVAAPESVFFEDRIRGEVLLKDDSAEGQAFTLTIKDGDKVVWEKKLLGENKPVRSVPFDFDVKEIAQERVQAAAATRDGTERTGVNLDLRVSVSPVEGERELTNNESSLRFRAITQKRKVLIVDGRPRWESRYLRNMFERDEQWETTAVIAGSRSNETGLARGSQPDQFPADKETLDTFDLIIFGEVPRSAWRSDELQWIRDFAEKRGGAVLFIDGARGRLAEYRETPIGPLFPVDFDEATPVREGIQKISLTDRAASLAPFSLSAERETNREIVGQIAATPLDFRRQTAARGGSVDRS